MDKTIADAKANGYVSTLFGRRRALPELNSNNLNIRASGERMARNTPIQGTAADVIKLAWCVSGGSCGTRKWKAA